MLELIQKIKLYTEAGIILEHMELFDEAEFMTCENCKHGVSSNIIKLNTFICREHIDSQAHDVYKVNNKDFGCNKWEKK